MSDYFFTWTAQRDARPMHVTGGQGAHFETSDGKRWLDLGSLSYQASLGHGRVDIISAIQAQAQTLCLAPPTASFPAKEEAARRLLDLAPPGFSKVFFTLGGAEANENALKMARLFTGRYKMLSRYHSYHGASMGALSLTGDYRRPPLEPGLPGIVRFLGDDPDRFEETMALEGARSIAGVILEAVPGANGVVLARPDFWPRVRRVCDHHGTLLIADEVLTGFGRTGRAFAFEHEGVVPDIITVAKAVTAGYAPMGAVLVHERVASYFDDHVLYAGLTAYAHPLGCAAAAATLRAYETENLFERAAALEPVLLETLRTWVRKWPAAVPAARGRGLLAAVDLILSDEGWRLLIEAVEQRGLFLHISKGRKTAIFAPPLCIDKDVLVGGLADFGECLQGAVEQS